MNLKKLNILLSFALLIITIMVVIKFFNSPAPEKIDLAQVAQEQEKQDTPLFVPEYSEEQIKRRYEELKVERLVTAMKSHHTRDVHLIMADGIDFDLVSKSDYEQLKKIAQEENYLHIIKPILKE